MERTTLLNVSSHTLRSLRKHPHLGSIRHNPKSGTFMKNTPPGFITQKYTRMKRATQNRTESVSQEGEKLPHANYSRNFQVILKKGLCLVWFCMCGSRKGMRTPCLLGYNETNHYSPFRRQVTESRALFLFSKSLSRSGFHIFLVSGLLPSS